MAEKALMRVSSYTLANVLGSVLSRTSLRLLLHAHNNPTAFNLTTAGDATAALLLFVILFYPIPHKLLH